MKNRNLEGTNNDLSNIISNVLNDNEFEEYEMTQFFSIIDNRISFNPESFRQFILNGNGDLFIIIIRKT